MMKPKQLTSFAECSFVVIFSVLIMGIVYFVCSYFSFSTPSVIVINFIISFILMHCYFFVIKQHHSPNIRMFIDYVYLSVAALGIVFSSIDYIHSERDKERFALVKKLEESISTVKWLVMNDRFRYCPFDKLDNLQCKGLIAATAASEIMYQTALSFEERRDSSVVSDLNIEARALSLLFSHYTSDDADVLRRAVKVTERNLQPIIDDAEASKAWFDVMAERSNLRVIGLILLSSALALRLTKVTVELKSWFRKT
jgi:hypothetical protein